MSIASRTEGFILLAGDDGRAVTHTRPVNIYNVREVSTTKRRCAAFYASSVDSGSASGWVRYGFVQMLAPLASAFLALESARLSSKAKLARAGHAR